jgi:hypothetical protein
MSVFMKLLFQLSNSEVSAYAEKEVAADEKFEEKMALRQQKHIKKLQFRLQGGMVRGSNATEILDDDEVSVGASSLRGGSSSASMLSDEESLTSINSSSIIRRKKPKAHVSYVSKKTGAWVTRDVSC